MDEKKKKIVISTCLIVVFILAIVGISYAAFRFVGQGNKVNQITTGTISMNYEESTNVIRLNNALPTTDATGKVRLVEGEYFDFSVITNITGEAVINWEIAAEDFSDNTFDGSNVKFYLTKLVDGNEVEVNSNLPAVYNEETSENNKTGRPANMMSLLTGSTNTQGEETINYRLRLYVDEAYNPQGDGGGLIFKTRVNVYGKVDSEENKSSIMKAYLSSSKDDYHATEYKNKITSIVTKTDTNVPTTALNVTNGKGNYWDVSEAGDDSVIAYIEDDGSENGTYKVTIGGNKGIIANNDSSYLFNFFASVKEIYLNSLDTSNVEDMRSMFSLCGSLTSLDVSNFDTSRVTSMQSMFDCCNNLTSVNLSGFDTSKVITMKNMFANCKSLTNLDLSHFDTSNVTDMESMFEACSSLTSLDLSNFNTSNVTTMQTMFTSCSNLLSLNLSSFDTSKVTKMMGMFLMCRKLTSITVGNLWTTENANKSGMFDECGTDHVTVV